MRGTGITNSYVINGKEYLAAELSKADNDMIAQCADRSAYNQLLNTLLEKFGDNVVCTIRIQIPEQLMEVYTGNGEKLII